MRYRELLENEKKLREELGNKKVSIVSQIIIKTSGKISSSEALAIVSTLTNEELDMIYDELFNGRELIKIETNPHQMALHLRMNYISSCRPEAEWGATKNRFHKILFGACEFVETYEKNPDFEISDKLAILHGCICDNCKASFCRYPKAYIYIYIPNGEHI